MTRGLALINLSLILVPIENIEDIRNLGWVGAVISAAIPARKGI